MTTNEKLRADLFKANIQDHPELRGLKINEDIEANHPNGDEIAILRKTIYKILLLIEAPQFEFKEFFDYYAEAEKAKSDFDDMVK